MSGSPTIGNWLRRAQAVLPLVLCIALVVFGVLAQPAAIDQFVNSDSLLPPHMAWEMTRHDYALANFQWPRVPSLPDLAFFFAMELAGVNWRSAVLIYTCLVTVALVTGMGWVIARMRGAPYRRGLFWAGMAVFVALAGAVLTLAWTPAGSEPLVPQLYLFVSVTHGDALLLSLAASCTALGAIRGSRWQAWITWIICAVGMFSDTIFLGYFLAPFILAGIVIALRHGGTLAAPSLRAIGRFAAKATAACFIGWLGKLPLLIQKMQLVLPGPSRSLALFLEDLPRVPWVLLLLALTMLVGIKTWRSAAVSPTAQEIEREWLALSGVGASLMSLGLGVLLYDDSYAYRYMIPFFWWPLAVALGTIRLPESKHICLGVVIAAALATVALPLSGPLLPGWRAPLEQCLNRHRAEWGLKAGLTSYWQSRLVMASSNWKLQLDQIDEEGKTYLWGNNFVAYHHDLNAPERPPYYNFVVAADKIDAVLVETFFGPAARHEMCGDLDVLIFPERIRPWDAKYRQGSPFEFEFAPMED